ncbi:crotonase/enoyl-CoA hydratase family protein [Salipiger sp. P9]|uniref:crotonase/enoyl-CoA hydratase family protein n=1 Tax=Salipiger pentaromativorans TaxID=2943193 RepID=UPI0021582148|nr:crotonase/enoyl-CoA hydratase family protein [Salipiger pentaromativorans]MCR8547574.1 crotonase/enoyl-CoA hydratase family protein [Salipiger pentaromativorans]
MSAVRHDLWQAGLPECLSAETRGGIGILTLNRPAKRNALNDALVLGLETAFGNVPEEVRAIVLRGEGDHFCAGLDLNELREASMIESFHTSGIGQRLNNTLQFCRVPVVSVLHGAVIGGGLELAAASHLRVAEPSAFYGLPEGMRGIFVGSGGSVRLPRLIGAATVMDMMLTGRTYGAEEAHRDLRLTQYLVGPGEGLAKAMDLAERITRNAPLANFAITQALPRIVEQAPQEGLFTEMLMVSIAQNDEEAKRRLREFLVEKKNKVQRS